MRQRGEKRTHAQAASTVLSANMFLGKRQKKNKKKLQTQPCLRLYLEVSAQTTVWHVQVLHSVLLRLVSQNRSYIYFCYTSKRGRRKSDNKLINER